MNWGKAFAITLVILQVGACVAYFAQGDWKHGLYWLFATGITAVVTFLI